MARLIERVEAMLRGEIATSRMPRWGSPTRRRWETRRASPTLELKINFLRPVWKARLRAEGRVVKRKTIGMVECDVTDETGSLVAPRAARA
jgi:acyl-coenzyme A thioesterase PaaI-like protein